MVEQSDQRFLLEGVSWSAYVALRDSLDRAGRRVKLTYLESRTLIIDVREDGEYVRRARSELLPEMDPELLASFVRPGESHTALAKAYRAALRRG